MIDGWSFEGWYYHRQEAVLGPLTIGELRLLSACRHIKPTDTVWKGLKRGADLLLLPAQAKMVLKMTAKSPRQQRAA